MYIIWRPSRVKKRPRNTHLCPPPPLLFFAHPPPPPPPPHTHTASLAWLRTARWAAACPKSLNNVNKRKPAVQRRTGAAIHDDTVDDCAATDAVPLFVRACPLLDAVAGRHGLVAHRQVALHGRLFFAAFVCGVFFGRGWNPSTSFCDHSDLSRTHETHPSAHHGRTLPDADALS